MRRPGRFRLALPIRAGAALLLLATDLRAAADFSSSTLDDGVAVGTSLRTGFPLTFSVRVANRGTSDGINVIVRMIVASTCLDATSFNPSSFPSQVVVNGAPASVSWNSIADTLDVQFTSP